MSHLCFAFKIWSGDHRQTAGGLQQTEETKMCRRKLLKRPLTLRCPTEYIQPNGLADIVARYLKGHLDSPQVTLARFLRDRTGWTGRTQSKHTDAEGCSRYSVDGDAGMKLFIPSPKPFFFPVLPSEREALSVNKWKLGGKKLIECRNFTRPSQRKQTNTQQTPTQTHKTNKSNPQGPVKIRKQVRGVRAIVVASSILPFCCPSSSNTTSACISPSLP